jgi:hypothetical protein
MFNMREHNYPAQFYEYVRYTINNIFTDTEADQTIEDAIRRYISEPEEPKKKDINHFKFLSK